MVEFVDCTVTVAGTTIFRSELAAKNEKMSKRRRWALLPSRRPRHNDAMDGPRPFHAPNRSCRVASFWSTADMQKGDQACENIVPSLKYARCLTIWSEAKVWAKNVRAARENTINA